MSENETNFELPSVEEVAVLFPDYEDFSFIARGGMSVVYKAVKSSLEREVAIKILPRELSENDSYRTLFHKEAKAMAKLSHPSLIAIYDFGQAGDYLYICMEYINGRALHYSIWGETIDPTTAGKLTLDILKGLSEAHRNNVVHRDISPGNIFLTTDAQPKIGDFGLSLDSAHQEEDSAHGTPGYTAPEILNAPEKIDHRADLYSAGIMFFQMLSGTVPPEFELDANGEPVTVECPESFQNIILKAIEANPDLRYQSSQDMITDLEAALSAESAGGEQTKMPIKTSVLAPDLKTANWASPHPAMTVHNRVVANVTRVQRPVAVNHAAHSTRAVLSGRPSAQIARPPTRYKKKSSAGPLFLFILLLALIAGGYYYYQNSQSTPSTTPELPVTLPTE